MPSPEVLKTAVKLLWTGNPETVSSEEFRVENLSSREKERLDAQLEGSRAWKLGDKRNVVGLGVAENRQGRGSTGELALTVYVKKKYPVSRLDRAHMVPPRLELEGLGEELLTDVREVGELRLESLRVEKRPIICGYSIGRTEEGLTGTLGCLVSRREGDRKWLLLSNSHVLANSGLGRPGDPIYQPGPDDTEQTLEPVAALESWQPFRYEGALANRVDAALAEPFDPKMFDPTIFDIGLPKGVRVAERGMMVQKSGRTSGHTWGKIDDVDFTTSVPYPRPDGKGYALINFTDLIQCSRCTEPGDSGSLVLDADGYAVGLHFCGTPTISVFNPIQSVLDELNIDLVTQLQAEG